jgi:hypothetical protein
MRKNCYLFFIWKEYVFLVKNLCYIFVSHEKCVFLIWKKHVLLITNECFGKVYSMCPRSGISFLYPEGICVSRSKIFVFYLERIHVPGQECVFFIWKEYVFQV